MSDPNMKVSDILGTGPTLEPLNAPEPFDPAKCDPFVLVAANTELAAENQALRSTLGELVERTPTDESEIGSWCAYCGESEVDGGDHGHTDNCPYIAAKSLLDDSKCKVFDSKNIATDPDSKGEA